jgi:type II secretory pathway component PulF
MFFNYRARDDEGVCSSGKVEAADEDSAVKQYT